MERDLNCNCQICTERAPNVSLNNSYSSLQWMNGVVIRKVTQFEEIIAQALTGLPLERANKYKITPLNGKLHALKFIGDKSGWRPTNRELEKLDESPEIIVADEDSTFGERFLFGFLGCLNLRPLKMKFSNSNKKCAVFDDEDFEIERKFRLGGLCCCPHVTLVRKHGKVIGKVEEDWRCGKNYFQRCFQQELCCMSFYDFKMAKDLAPGSGAAIFEDRFHMNVNTCCFGSHNNCCGSTCFFNDMLWDIYRYKIKPNNSFEESNVSEFDVPVARLQKTFGGSSLDDFDVNALCRLFCLYNNYVLEFPKDATLDEKLLLLGGFVHSEYINFERNGHS